MKTFTSMAHPQANVQVEVTNKTIMKGMKKDQERCKGIGWTNYSMSCGRIEKQFRLPLKKH